MQGVRKHALFLGLVLAAVALRILVLLAYHPALLFRGDSYMYVNNARHLVPKFYHPLVYPIFVWPWVHAHLIGAIPLVQHGLGIAVAVALYALLRRLGAGQWACLGAVPVLFDGYQLSLEQFVMSETLFTALVVLALVLVCWRDRPSSLASVGAALTLAAAALSRNIGVVLIVPLVVYMVVRRARAVAVVAAIATFAVPLVLYASWFKSGYGRLELSGADGYYLYGRVAIFADCGRLRPLPDDMWLLCDPRPPSDRPGLNSYVWGTPPESLLASRAGVDRSGFLERFAIRAIVHEPGTYGRVVLHDMTHYFSPWRNTGVQDEGIRHWQFPDTYAVFAPAPNRKGIIGPGPARRHAGGVSGFLQDYQGVAYTPGPLLLLALVLGCVGLIGLPRGARRRLRAECALFTSAGIAVLLVPAMTAMFDFRYLLPALALLPPAGVLGGLVVAGRIRGSRRGDPSKLQAPFPVARERTVEPAG